MADVKVKLVKSLIGSKRIRLPPPMHLVFVRSGTYPFSRIIPRRRVR